MASGRGVGMEKAERRMENCGESLLHSLFWERNGASLLMG
jgi:hypothetical protein